MNRLTIRRINELNVLREVFNQTPTSRAAVAKKLGLTKSTVYNIFTTLANDNLIYDIGQGNSTRSGGRKPVLTNFNAQAGYTINTKINQATISCMTNWLDGSIVNYQEFPIDGKDASQQLLALYQAIKLSTLDDTDLMGISVAIYGVVKDNHIVKALSPDLAQYDLVQILQSRFNVPVLLENEANLAALAIKDFSGGTIKNALALSLTDQIGVGSIIAGQLYTGTISQAGEIGAARYYGLGSENMVSLEEVGSDRAVFKEIQTLKQTSVVIADIRRWYDLGDETVQEILKNFETSMVIILQNLFLLFDPEKVVVSSRILQSVPELLKEIEEKLSQVLDHPVDIEVASNVNNNSLLGGCAMITRSILELPDADLQFKNRTMPTVGE
ncbi:ROK family transcriptional regulator [Companilactobacillus sp. HBUAS56275]|uniref:ROK family transcriptional regulator n=1 Tax=Candidatus Companilactobacillus pullicola TaxID=2838523 RepID=A0A9D1ZR87_9LACO|nr:ROK family transcriptional regulator [Candidatus Companilactobacillus pullicola]